MGKVIKKLLEWLSKPETLLLCLAVLYFLSIPSHFEGLCLYNWSEYWGEALVIVVAALALWIGKAWGYAAAMYLTGQALYEVGYILLGFEPEIVPSEWWSFFVSDSLLYTSAILNSIIFSYSGVALVINSSSPSIH